MASKRPHLLFVSVPVEDYPVRAKDIVFYLYEGRGRASAKFGELRVSQGAIVWRGSRDQYGRKLAWRRFHNLMEREGSRAEIRPPGAKKSVPRRKRAG